MKPAPLAAGIVAVALGLSGCIVVQAPRPPIATLSPQGAGPVVVGSTMDCTDADLTLNESGANFTLTGDCGVITIEGTDILVDAANVEGIVIRGDRAVVSAASVGTVTLGGNDNSLQAEDIGSVTINGDRNIVTADTVRDVTVGGNDNAVAGTVSGAVVQNGDRNAIGG